MEEPTTRPQSKYLHRSQTNRVIGGVAGGLGEYFNIDPTIVRLLFVVLFFFHGAGILFYILLWLIIPPAGQPALGPEVFQAGAQEIGNKAKEYSNYVQADWLQRWLGVALLIVGVLFLLNSFGIVYRLDFGFLWPVFLIGLGILVLLRR